MLSFWDLNLISPNSGFSFLLISNSTAVGANPALPYEVLSMAREWSVPPPLCPADQLSKSSPGLGYSELGSEGRAPTRVEMALPAALWWLSLGRRDIFLGSSYTCAAKQE